MASFDIPKPDGLTQLPASNVTGIYFLWRGDVVVYVGQSKTISLRIGQHIQEGEKAFDGLSWVACSPSQLGRLEREFIDRLIPHYNRCGAANKARAERPWRIPTAATSTTGTSMAASLGLSEEQFNWLARQDGGPRRIRVPRKNIRRWSWSAMMKWATNNRDLLEAAKAQTF